MVKEERVRNIIDQINFYGHDVKRAKGLVFCSRNEEAKELSKHFNRLGRIPTLMDSEEHDAVEINYHLETAV